MPMDPCGWSHAAPALAEGRPRPGDFPWCTETPALEPRDDGLARHMPAMKALGLPGLLDAHTHWFPDSVNRKIWAYFDEHYWPITYRMGAEERLDWLRRNGVRRFTVLTYAHKAGMAEWLNDNTAELAARVPEAIPCGTFYPEPEAAAYVRRGIEQLGFRGFKLHVRVGGFDLAQPGLYPVFEQIEAAGLPVVLHIGNGPDPGPFTRPQVLQRLLLRFPQLRVVVAHMGGNEFEEYLRLAEARPTVHLDTTMVFVGFLALHRYPVALLSRLEAVSGQILFGSDFPTIPYPLSHAVEGVLGLLLSDQAKRRVLWENAARLFAIPR